MTRREKITKIILQNMAEFIYDNELELGNFACLERCKQNRISCPFGEAHSKDNCLQCINEFLNKEDI